MINFEGDPEKRLTKAILKASKKVEDLTVPLTLMTREWYKSNRSIFDKRRKGPGKYEDLSPKYKIIKEAKYGFTYPILRASGRLAESMTSPQSPESINRIINKKALELGTSTPYASYLHFGTKKMPARPLALIGAEQVAPKLINQRLENWVKLMEDWVYQVTSGKEGKDFSNG